MTSYRVTLTLNERGLLGFFGMIGDRRIPMTVEVESEPEGPAANEPGAIYRPERGLRPQRQHRQRKSKVIDTITGVLAEGPAEAAALKKALTDAGLSPGSLGTGIQILRKDGAVGHDEEGRYYLTGEREAAE